MQKPTAAAWLGMDGGGFRSSLGKRVARLLQLNPRASASVRVPWYLRIVLPLICTFAVWLTMNLVPGNTETRSSHPWRDSFIGSALAALAEPETPAVPEALGEAVRIEVARLVQEGKLYYETGRLTEAEKSLSAARKLDPENKAAAHYLNLLRAAKQSAAAQGEVEQEWTEPVPKRQRFSEKIRHIRLPEFGPYDNAPLPDVVRDLADRARSLDPEREGIKLFLNPNADDGTGRAVDAAGLPVKPPTDLAAIRITLRNPLKDLTLEQVLNFLVRIADGKIKYSIEDYGIVIANNPETGGTPLHTRFFKIEPNTLSQSLSNVIALGFGEQAPRRGLRRRPDAGIDSPDDVNSTTELSTL
jgi:tetratricopeptide (TPR) repeat protein